MYSSCEETLTRWPSTVVGTGINKINGKINVFAAFGLNDIFSMTIRPNTGSGLRRLYEGKTKKLLSKWPTFIVHPWPDA